MFIVKCKVINKTIINYFLTHKITLIIFNNIVFSFTLSGKKGKANLKGDHLFIVSISQVVDGERQIDVKTIRRGKCEVKNETTSPIRGNFEVIFGGLHANFVRDDVSLRILTPLKFFKTRFETPSTFVYTLSLLGYSFVEN